MLRVSEIKLPLDHGPEALICCVALRCDMLEGRFLQERGGA
jgi:hypothetical protein